MKRELIFGLVIGFLFPIIIFISNIGDIQNYAIKCGPEPFWFQAQNAKNNWCQVLIQGGCNSTSTDEINVRFDVNQDGKTDSSDTLLELCKYYKANTDKDCKKLCGC
jgi:hypothetical protein